ncbi:MAG TPA: hypothetical protein VJI68_00815 [Candidatus Nanoarchaeia archaeon]|nr:hypothetical protein [Candidatus Nanoarchaeia archaeon]
MKLKSVRRLIEQHTEEYSKWWDDSLDSDGVDLEQWGFCQGYYEESS